MFDVIVVGGGVMGSSATYHLAKRGQNVLLLDQFPFPPHSHAIEGGEVTPTGSRSSGGKSRAFRNVYAEEFLARMASESLSMWRQLERESGSNILVECGCLKFAGGGEGNGGVIAESEEILDRLGVEKESFADTDRLRRRYPQMNFADGEIGVLDVTAGVLRADAALAAFRGVATENGADIRGEETVVAVLKLGFHRSEI